MINTKNFEYRSNSITRIQRIKTKAFYKELFVFVLRNNIEDTKNNNGIIFNITTLHQNLMCGMGRIITQITFKLFT